MRRDNKVASILLWIGMVLMMACFIVGFTMSYEDYPYTDFNFGTAFVWWAGGFVSGMLLIACSEVIELLQKISNRLGEDSRK
ncbi:hypothetical protein AB6A23_16920 [Paenibacillus tarimensis]